MGLGNARGWLEEMILDLERLERQFSEVGFDVLSKRVHEQIRRATLIDRDIAEALRAGSK